LLQHSGAKVEAARWINLGMNCSGEVLGPSYSFRVLSRLSECCGSEKTKEFDCQDGIQVA
jgi:hypothetical protein